MRFRYTVSAILLTGLCAFAQQQSNPNAPPPAHSAPAPQPSKNCSWQATKGSKGPWNSTSNCEQSPAGQNTPRLLPGENSEGGQQTPAAANPFPEAKSEKAEDAAQGSPAKSAQGVSSSHVDLDRLNAPEGSVSRISNGEGGYIHDPALAKHDEKVGKFYMQTGDYKGAYDRFLEATRVAPEDGNAVFELAQAAQGLHRTKEAATNYQIYLDAFPDGKKAKDARKALAELNAGPKK